MKNNETTGKSWLSDRLGFLRPAGPFLFAVLISASIWVINSLNKTHTSSVEFQLQYSRISTAPEKGYTRSVTAEVSGKGFDLIRFLAEKKFHQLDIQGTEKGRIPALERVNRHVLMMDKSIHVNRVTPAFIDLPQTQLYSKKLKVVPDVHFVTAASYVKTIPAIAVPDSLLVFSELPIPDSITRVRTNRIEKKQLQSSWFGSARPMLGDSGHLVPQTDKIWIYQPVEEATEISISLPVNPGRGIPYNFRFIPASVTVTCIVPISRYAITTADKFLVTASVTSTEQERAIVRVITAPPWAENVRHLPSSVEFLNVRP